MAVSTKIKNNQITISGALEDYPEMLKILKSQTTKLPIIHLEVFDDNRPKSLMRRTIFVDGVAREHLETWPPGKDAPAKQTTILMDETGKILMKESLGRKHKHLEESALYELRNRAVPDFVFYKRSGVLAALDTKMSVRDLEDIGSTRAWYNEIPTRKLGDTVAYFLSGDGSRSELELPVGVLGKFMKASLIEKYDFLSNMPRDSSLEYVKVALSRKFRLATTRARRDAEVGGGEASHSR